TDERWGSGVWIGEGEGGQSEGGGGTRHGALRLGAGRMLHSGCCVALKSHLALTLYPQPEGG
ncbi:Hypothetical predicted protein, partial [Xyrichtys novacula]